MHNLILPVYLNYWGQLKDNFHEILSFIFLQQKTIQNVQESAVTQVKNILCFDHTYIS